MSEAGSRCRSSGARPRPRPWHRPVSAATVCRPSGRLRVFATSNELRVLAVDLELAAFALRSRGAPIFVVLAQVGDLAGQRSDVADLDLNRRGGGGASTLASCLGRLLFFAAADQAIADDIRSGSVRASNCSWHLPKNRANDTEPAGNEKGGCPALFQCTACCPI